MAKNTKNRKISGVFKTQTEEEFVAALMGVNRHDIYKQMSMNDPICGAVWLALMEIFETIKPVPRNDTKGFVAKSIKSAKLADRMPEILTFLLHGFSLFEGVWGGENGVTYLKHMLPRPQATITDWIYDGIGNIVRIKQSSYQMGYGKQFAEINYNKCFHFALNQTMNTPWGKSLLRNAYRSWYYKTNIEKIQAIAIERDLTGVAVLSVKDDKEVNFLDADGSFTPEAQWAWETVQNIKNNEQEGLVLDENWKFELVSSPGQKQIDINQVLNKLSSDMAVSMLAQFILLGLYDSTGTSTLATEQNDLFYRAVDGYVKLVERVLNESFIGIRGLNLVNGTDAYLALEGASKPNLTDTAAFLARLVKLGVIIPDDNLEIYLRGFASLPERDPSTERRISGVFVDDEQDKNTE